MIMRGTQFAELSAFVAVAEHRNFTKAAAQLGLSRSSLSQIIRSFEERLGVRLLQRTTRSVALTEVGERLLRDAEPALDGIDKAIESVNLFRDKPTGALRLSMPQLAASLIVRPVLARFLTKFPDIKLEIAVDETHSDIVTGRFDAGIRLGERIEKDMIAVRLLDQRSLLVVASPAYLKQKSLPESPQDLHAHDCVRLRSDWDGKIQPWTFDEQGRRFDVVVDGRLVVNDWNLIVSGVCEGIGIGYVPEPLVAPHIASGRLTPLLEKWSLQLSGVFLFYPSRRQMPGTLRGFIDFMRAEGGAALQAAI
jgi:DNA-binding transcriptional LysR family regulator